MSSDGASGSESFDNYYSEVSCVAQNQQFDWSIGDKVFSDLRLLITICVNFR